MKIVIPGGSGQVGTVLARALHADGHEVIVLSRSPQSAEWRTTEWDGVSLGRWANSLDGADAVINLAGQSVNCRYTPNNRRLILSSRIDSTNIIARAIGRANSPPGVWLQASTATIYENRYTEPNDEASGIVGGNEPGVPASWKFSVDVATAWEQALDDADVPNTRRVKLRSAMIMSPDRGGVFDAFYSLARMGVGGKMGSGDQYVSWIHSEDFVTAVKMLITSNEIEGAVNIASPHPVTNSEFMQTLRKQCGAVFGLPMSKLMLELGAVIKGTETELLLKSRHVIPGRLTSHGFQFKYPDWEDAARDLCAKRRGGAGSAPPD